MNVKETIAAMRAEAERMYAFESSPYSVREAKGMISVIKAVEDALETGEYLELCSDFGTRLKQVRIDLHMTQPEAAEMLGHSVRCQQEYETNRRDPGTKRAKEIADAMGVPFMWLLGYGDTFSCGNPHGSGD